MPTTLNPKEVGKNTWTQNSLWSYPKAGTPILAQGIGKRQASRRGGEQGWGSGLFPGLLFNSFCIRGKLTHLILYHRVLLVPSTLVCTTPRNPETALL